MSKPWIIKSDIKRTKFIISKEKLFDLYIIKKYSTRKIGKMFDVCNITISRKLKKYNIKTRQLKHPIPINKIIYLYCKLYHSLQFIAKKFKSTSTRIRNILVNNHIIIRGKSYYSTGSRSGNWKGGKPKCIICHLPLERYTTKMHWKCYLIWSRIPKNNGNYHHGKCYEPYSEGWNKYLRESIRKRDNYKCQLCGTEQKNLTGFHKKLIVHHIDYSKNNHNNNNLISLCKYCHGKTNADRNYWFAFFRYLLENK